MEIYTLLREGLNSLSIVYDDRQVEAFVVYLDELQKWNKRINLVGLKNREDIVKRLLFDALFIQGYIRESKRLMDLGSGSGIIGIPLSILNKKMEIFSVDKSLKKIQFQRHIKRILSLKAFTPIESRIEMLTPLAVDTIVVKGFGRISNVLDKTKNHLLKGGKIFFMKGKKEAAEEYEGFSILTDIPYKLPMNDNTYRLFIYRKQ